MVIPLAQGDNGIKLYSLSLILHKKINATSPKVVKTSKLLGIYELSTVAVVFANKNNTSLDLFKSFFSYVILDHRDR
jgi:hypothetical protein